MTLLAFKIIAAFGIFIVALLFAYYPFKKSLGQAQVEKVELGEAFASGIFLGAAFFHLLPDAISKFNEFSLQHLPLPEMICVGGFLLLLLLERITLTHPHQQKKNTIPYILILMLSIHAITEGAALGVGNNLSTLFILLIAILAHKGSESYALVVTLLRHHLSPRIMTLTIVLFALMSPLGIFLGNSVNALTESNHGMLISACFNAFAAGTFLYISTLHHIHFHEHAEDAQGMWEFVTLLLGVLLMGIITIWV